LQAYLTLVWLAGRTDLDAFWLGLFGDNSKQLDCQQAIGE
jgi:hypothetical protein